MWSCGNTSSQETKQRFKVNLTYTLWLFGLLAGDRSATGNIEQVASSRPRRVASASPCREKLKAQQTTVQSDDDARRHLKTIKAHSSCCQKSTSRPLCAIDSVFHVKQVFFLFFSLSSTPQIAIGHMARVRVTLPERSYPPAAHRKSFVQSRGGSAGHRGRTIPSESIDKKRKVILKIKSGSLANKENEHQPVSVRPQNFPSPDSEGEFSVLTQIARLLSHAPTCWSTMCALCVSVPCSYLATWPLVVEVEVVVVMVAWSSASTRFRVTSHEKGYQHSRDIWRMNWAASWFTGP